MEIRWAARHRATRPHVKERALKQTNSRVMAASMVPQWSRRSPSQPRKLKEITGISCHKSWGLM
jgi:hypothetical protein